MKGNFRLLFDSVYDDISDLCGTLRGRINLANALIAKDDFLSKLNDYAQDITLKNLVACLHIAHSSRATMIIAIDENSNTARARFWSPDFKFLTKEMISLDFLIIYAKSIVVSSQEGSVMLTIDVPVSFGE